MSKCERLTTLDPRNPAFLEDSRKKKKKKLFPNGKTLGMDGGTGAVSGEFTQTRSRKSRGSCLLVGRETHLSTLLVTSCDSTLLVTEPMDGSSCPVLRSQPREPEAGLDVRKALSSLLELLAQAAKSQSCTTFPHLCSVTLTLAATVGTLQQAIADH